MRSSILSALIFVTALSGTAYAKDPTLGLRVDDGRIYEDASFLQGKALMTVPPGVMAVMSHPQGVPFPCCKEISLRTEAEVTSPEPATRQSVKDKYRFTW